MKWKCRVATLFIGIIGVVCSSPGEASAQSQPWREAPIVVQGAGADTGWAQNVYCAGRTQLVLLQGWAQAISGCVYGDDDGVRMVRYHNLNGIFAYALSFKHETHFTPVDNMCVDMGRCAYGHETDVLINSVYTSGKLSVTLLKDVTKHLVRVGGATPRLRLEYNEPQVMLLFGDTPVSAGAVGVSKNGRWGVVEAEGAGLFRIDLTNLTYRRSVISSVKYGYGTNPSYELTISNDGTAIAASGWNVTPTVYVVDDTCGDIPTSSTPEASSVSCPSVTMDIPTLFPGLIAAYEPRFSRDDMQLSVFATTYQGTRRVAIGPDTLGLGGFDADSHSGGYAAFGDSFTSGEGETNDDFYKQGTNSKSNRCHVSLRSYPYLLGDRYGVPTYNAACSGSRTTGVRLASEKYKSEIHSSQSPSLVSVGVGGNDVDLMGKLKTCLGIGTCEWALPDKRLATAYEIKRLFPRMISLMREIKTEHPQAAIALIGYPRVVNVEPPTHCRVLVSALLSEAERRYLDESVKYLNAVLRQAANVTGVQFIAINDSLAGERLCDESEASMNGIRTGDDIAPIPFLTSLKFIGAESFHPTPRGHDRITQYIAAQYPHGWASSCECSYDDTELFPSGYWTAGYQSNAVPYEHDVRQLVAEELLDNPTILPGSAQVMHVASGAFLPGSKVEVELHSTPMGLVEGVAADDGSFTASFSLPDGVEGYHTLHALGQSSSGATVDLYQTLAIHNNEPLVNSGEQITAGSAVVVGTPGNSAMSTGANRQSSASVVDSSTFVPDAIATVTSPEGVLGEAYESRVKTGESKGLLIHGSNKVDLRRIVRLAVASFVVCVIAGWWVAMILRRRRRD